MSETIPFSTPSLLEVAPRFAEILPALIGRGRAAVRSGLLGESEEMAGALEALLVDTLRAFTAGLAAGESPREWAAPLAEATGGRVLVSQRSLHRGGRRGAEAFERAYLVAMLWELRRRLVDGEGLSPRTSWENGLPLVLAGDAAAPELLFLCARSPGTGVGDGLAVGYALSGDEVAVELLVPCRGDDGAAICALQIRREV